MPENARIRTPRWATRVAVGVLATATVMSLAACSKSSGGSGSSSAGSTPGALPAGVATGTSAPIAASTKVGDTFTFANSAGPSNLNPALGGNGRLGAFVLPAYASLTKLAANGTVQPDLATSWKYVGTGNKVFELTIRAGAKFSDGEAVTGQAVAGSINYFRKAAGPFAKVLGTVTSVKAQGQKVTVTSSAANPEMPQVFSQYWMAGLIISPAGIANPAKLGTTTSGAGPYVLDPSATVSGSTYTYKPNPNYWDKSAQHWKTLVIKVFADTNSAFQSLQSGQVQMMIADPITAATLNTNSVQVLASPVQWSGIQLFDRTGKVTAALGKVEVRQALNYAIDKATIAKSLYGKYAVATSTVQGPGWTGYDAAADKAYPYDPAKAKTLLAQAGYPKGFSMTIIEQKTTATDALLQAIAAQLAKVGVTVNIKADPTTPAWVADLLSLKYPGSAGQLNFTSPYLLWSGSYDSSFNPMGTTDPVLNKLVAQAAAASPSASDALWQKVFARLTTQAWFIPVVRSDSVYISAKTVSAIPPGQAININPADVAVAATS